MRSITNQKQRYPEFLSSYPNNQEAVDLSLFRGEAGIGYFLLCLEDTTIRQPNVLFPFVNLDGNQLLKIQSFDVDALVLKSNYLSEFYNPVKQNAYHEEITDTIAREAAEGITDDHLLRTELFKLRQTISNSHFDTIKLLRLKSFHADELPKKLTLSATCKVLELKNKPVILKRTFGFAQPIEIDEVQLAIYKICQHKGIVKYTEIEDEIMRLTEVETDDEKQFIKERILEQVCQSFADGVLEEAY